MNSTRLTLTITVRGKPVNYAVRFVDGAVKLTRWMPQAKRAVTRTVTLGVVARCDCPAARFNVWQPCKHILSIAKHGVLASSIMKNCESVL